MPKAKRKQVRTRLQPRSYRVSKVHKNARSALHYLWEYRQLPKSNRWGYVRIAIGTKALYEIAELLNSIPR